LGYIQRQKSRAKLTSQHGASSIIAERQGRAP
jgi:hypothetical protein